MNLIIYLDVVIGNIDITYCISLMITVSLLLYAGKRKRKKRTKDKAAMKNNKHGGKPAKNKRS